MNESSAILFRDVIGTYINTMNDNYSQVFSAYTKILGRKMKLKIIQVGENYPYAGYVKNKKEDGEKLGIDVSIDLFPETITEEELINIIKKYNDDEGIDGISITYPLPRHIRPVPITQAIDPMKDVDGFHFNSECYPCTPFGIVIFLKTIGQAIQGKHILLIGTGPIIGRPLIKMLITLGAVVTACDEKVDPKLLQTLLYSADIVITSVNKPHILTNHYIYNPGSIIIDAAIFKDEDGQLRGSCDPDLKGVAQTPVPGGVNLLSRLAVYMNLAYLYEKRSGNIHTNKERNAQTFIKQ